jgi:pimeloyl-ACP methyl ester carboxylesterase
MGDENSPKIAIILPGRLDTKDYAHILSHVNYLNTKGYYAMSFDPPGTWDSPGEIELFTTTNYIKAVNELIEYYGNKPTLLVGHSRGGTISILVGSLDQYVEAIVVVMASYGQPTPPKSELIKAGVLMESRDLPPGTTRTIEQKKFALPINYFNDALQYNTADTLTKYTKPKLLFYGDNDQFTKPERVKEVFELTPGPKVLHELHTDHNYRLHPEVIDEVNRTISEFLLADYKL